MSEFDEVSANYEEVLNRGISLSGESVDYFARKRVDHTAKLHAYIDGKSETIMDYGCGTGGSVGYLLEAFNPNNLVATDISDKSLQVLKKKYNSPRIKAVNPAANDAKANCDLCFCNGVFHHIMPKDREEAAKFLYNSLNNGGVFHFWENNPWNPATHLVMRRITFDRNAVKIFPHQAAKLLKSVGFEIKLIHYLFIFPRFFKIFRPIERLVLRFPFGCQYLVLAQKN